MNIKLDKSIELLEPIVETRLSTLHKAVIDNNKEEAGLYYAVKVMPPEKKAAGVSLEKEMEITHQIENCSQSSVVIPILMHVEEEGHEYAIMQFKNNGKFLMALIEDLEEKFNGRIGIDIQLILMRKILSSLERIHHCLPEGDGFLHLDLHPHNIFVENVDLDRMEFGTVKFIDFQSALKVKKGGHAVRQSDFWHATEVYSAPELWDMDNPELSYKTDVYSVAAIFYRMLTGHEYSHYTSLNENDLPYPSIVQQQLKMVMNCCLEMDCNYRYGSAAEVEECLKRIQEYLSAYKKNDYYNLFAAAYSGWISPNQIQPATMHFDKKAFLQSVVRLAEDLKERSIDNNRCDYIFNGLWKLKTEFLDNEVAELKEKERRIIPSEYMKILSTLISSGISISNHMGNEIRATELFEELTEYKEEIPLMEYLEIMNRVAVMYSDCYSYKKAFDLIRTNIEALESIKKVYEEVAKKNGFYLDKTAYVEPLAKAYSSMGAYMTWLHMDGAGEYFEKAFVEFGDNIKEKEKTLSRFLHHAIQIEDGSGKGIALYEKHIRDYFGGREGFKERYEYVRDLAIGKSGRPQVYPLWIYIKGLLHFYSTDFADELFEEMKKDFENDIYNKANGFPMLLVYRYMGQLAYIRNGNKVDEFVDDAFGRSGTCCLNSRIDINKPLGMLVCINYDTERIYNEISGNSEKNEELLEMFKAHARKSGWKELEAELSNRKTLEGLLEFEYC